MILLKRGKKMNNFNSLYPLRRIHGIVHEWLERKKKKWEFILYICYPFRGEILCSWGLRNIPIWETVLLYYLKSVF